MSQRLKLALIGGVVLGLFCVVGVSIRSGMTASWIYIFALWFNRVLMGLLIGAPWPAVSMGRALLRGALFGLVVSFAFYSATQFQDHLTFLAGIGYGVLLEAFLKKMTAK